MPTTSTSISTSGILPISILIPILPPLLLPTLLRAHAPSIISDLYSNSNSSSTINRLIVGLIQFDVNLPGLMPAIAFSLLASTLTSMGIQATMGAFKQRGFKGKDLLKPGKKDEIPESMGLPSSCIYILLLFLFIPFRYFSHPSFSPFKAWITPLSSFLITPSSSTNTRKVTAPFSAMEIDSKGWSGDIGGREGFPHHELATFLSALLSLLSSIMLGFLDDVFDIRWRYKLPIPIISSVPLLVVYYAGGGGTSVVVPNWPIGFRNWLGGDVVNLGPLYYAYISLLSTFCTNSINILAGINGVEVGQALVIALSLCINDVLYLDSKAGKSGSFSSEELVQRHLFSLYLLLPFLGTCVGLLAWNRYPSRVFVGDTFCYFAGQVLACAGVLGHFSKTLLLFFLPQIFNFLFSCPQLFGMVPCPRHRIPRIHEETLSLYPSTTVFSDKKSISFFTEFLLRSGELFHLIKIYRDEKTGKITECSNLTLLNAILVMRGVERSNPIPPTTSTTSEKGSIISNGIKTQSRGKNHVDEINDTSNFSQVKESESESESEMIKLDSNVSLNQPIGPQITEYSLWLHVMGIQTLGSIFAFGVRYWVASFIFPNR